LATSSSVLLGWRGAYGTWRLGSCGALGVRGSFCVAGVALGDIHRHFAWQAWRFTTSTLVLRGRRGTYGTWRALVARLGPEKMQ
jgi:hypothetical protein